MKKTKWIKTLGAVAALAMPAATVMTTLSSCGHTEFGELANELKDATINEFITFSKNVHRNIWDEQEAFNYVKKIMSGMGFEPAGFDRWSEVPEIQASIASYRKTNPHYVTEKPIYGNIWYDIPATAGCEEWPKVILQAHLDSAMEFSSATVSENWVKAADEGGGTNITYDIERDILRGDGNTSIGSDNGIGLIILLNIARMRNEFPHGGIRLLFTAGESEATDNYAAGAAFLERDQLNGGVPKEGTESYLSDNAKKPFGESEGEFKYIISTAGVEKNTVLRSSAGIHECTITPTYDLPLNVNDTTRDSNKIDWTEKHPTTGNKKRLYNLSVYNCHGGHSATDINKGYANALTLLTRCLMTSDTTMQLISVDSTNTSAFTICSDSTATFASTLPIDLIKMRIESYWSSFKAIYPGENWSEFWYEPGKSQVTIKIEEVQVEESARPQWGLSKNQTADVIDMIANRLIFGPIDWFDTRTKQSVSCSCNYGPFKLNVDQNGLPKSSFEFHCVERSASGVQLQVFWALTHNVLSSSLQSVFKTTEESEYTTHADNPVWEVGSENRIVGLMQNAYQHYRLPLNVKDEHGWAEIACFPQIYDALTKWTVNMAVTGLQILNNHTVNEAVYTDSLEAEIKTLLYTLANINSIK